MMAEQERAISVAPLILGDRLKIKGREDVVGWIIEFRGALGPEGTAIYGVPIQTFRPL